MEAVDKISVGVSKEKAGQNTQEAITENADGMKVSLGEKICYGVGDIGANLVWTTVASFLTIYCSSRNTDADRQIIRWRIGSFYGNHYR